MSHLRIPRKQSHSPRNKIHSEQSKPTKYSVQRIVHQNVLRRRFTTHNNSFHKFDADNSKEHVHSKSKNIHSKLISSCMKNQIEEAKKAFKTKNTKKALPLFKKVYEKYPDVPDIPYFIGSCLLNQGKLAAALTYFNTTLQLDNNYDKNIYLYMAVCHKGMGRMQEAANILYQASEKYPRFQQAHFYKAKMHIKLNQINQAINSLKKCLIINNNNQLALIIYGDCLKKIGKLKQSLDKYDKALIMAGQYRKTAYIHKLNILVDLQSYQEILSTVDDAQEKNEYFPQFPYFQGLVEYKTNRFSQATIFFEMGLKQNLSKDYLSKIIKLLMRIAIIDKDCFGAEHLVKRGRLLDLDDHQILLYNDLIEGINDLIKRKVSEGQIKLSNVYQTSKNNRQYLFLREHVLSYYGYCKFLQDKMSQSLSIFHEYIDMPLKNQKKLIQKYNKNICEGILFHKNKIFEKAESKFIEASNIFPDRIQPIFFQCINQVQKIKKNQLELQNVSNSFLKINDMFKATANIIPPNSLFLFYESLVKLYQNKDACQTIQMSIKYGDEDVAQYYFIDALAHSINGEILRGLQSMNKAIDTDHNISQFFKERSKYLYLLERYPEACEDILKVILQNPDDQQGKLLLTFYYYLTDEHLNSLQLLKQLTNNQKNSTTQNKFSQFQQALHFRLGGYSSCGIIGTLILHIIQQQKLSQQKLSQILELVNSRSCYSQFNVYFMYLLLAAYYLYVQINDKEAQQNVLYAKFDTAIDCLFGSLEQINYNSDHENADNNNSGSQLKKSSKDQFSPAVQAMLSQVKFNIIIANLLRLSFQEKPEESLNLLNETIKFINVFIAETQDLEFIQVMKHLLNFLEEQNSQPKQYEIKLGGNAKKVSEQFPEIRIKIHQNKTIISKILVFYPQKLKFNIMPEFDESFLFNFDIDKIQAKLCPPWYKMQNQKLVFTDKIRNQSVLLSETEKSQTPILRAPSPIQISLRDKFKLNQSVERKLNKLMKK